MEKIAHIDFEKLNIKQDTKILDIGCGTGQVYLPLAQKGYKIIGFDLNIKRLKGLRGNCELKNIRPQLLIANGKEMPFNFDVFDIVVCREVLEHVENPREMLESIYKVLKPDGRLCISVPSSHTETYFQLVNPEWLEMAGHINVFSKNKLKVMLEENGFKVVETQGENFFYTFFWFFHSIVRTKHDGTGKILNHHKLANLIFRLWKKLGNGRIKWGIEKIGNSLFAKSYFYYCVRGKLR